MSRPSHVPIRQCWTLSGRYFGCWEGDDLWTHNGRHVGRMVGTEIYAPDGRYIGEVMGNGRLAVIVHKLGRTRPAYIAWRPSVPRTMLPDLDECTRRGGYSDFPAPEELAIAVPGVVMASGLA